MHINQYNVSIIEITVEDEEEVLHFLNSKLPLLKDYLLNIKGEITPKIEQFLDHNKIQYTKNLKIAKIRRAKRQKSDVEVYDRIIRSGEEIDTKNNVVCLKKVNDGSFIRTTANFISVGRVDGTIEANGDFLIFEKGPKGRIIFHNKLLDNFIDGKIYKVYWDQDEIIIEEIKERNGNSFFGN